MKKILFTTLLSFGIFIASASEGSSFKTGIEKPIIEKKEKPILKTKKKKVPVYSIRVTCGNGGGGTLCCYDTYAAALADVQFAIQWFCSPPFNV